MKKSDLVRIIREVLNEAMVAKRDDFPHEIYDKDDKRRTPEYSEYNGDAMSEDPSKALIIKKFDKWWFRPDLVDPINRMVEMNPSLQRQYADAPAVFLAAFRFGMAYKWYAQNQNLQQYAEKQQGRQR